MTKQIIVEDELIEDEISIGDVLSKLWRRRGVILAITLLSIGIALTYILIAATAKRTPVTLFVELTSIKEGKYPNGADFSPTDLKSPDIINALYEKYQFDDKKNPNDKNIFSDAITIVYGSSSILGTHQEFQRKLGTKGLTAADLEKINTDYKSAVNQISRRGLEIIFDYQSMGLQKDIAKNLVSEIPQLWNEIYLNKYRTLVDTNISDLVTDVNKISLSKTQGLLEALRNMTAMRGGLETLRKDNRFNAIVNDKGKGITDISKDLENFRNVYFTPLMAKAFHRKDPISVAYSRDIKLSINELDRNITTLNQISNEISEVRNRPAQNEGAKNSLDRNNLDLTDNTLSQILNIPEKASLSEYLKTILDSKRNLAFERSSLQTDLERFTLTDYMDIDEAYVSEAEEILRNIASNYSSLIMRIKKTAITNIHGFYTPIGKPDVFESKWPDRSLLILALAAFMGLVLSSAVALMTPAKHHRYLVNK